MGEHHYTNATWSHALVAAYTGLDFLQINALDYVQFLAWRRDAYITNMEQTEAGREYLRNAWRMEQTEPDRAALRRKFGREGGRR